ncbi:Hypothetical predicted protein [Octopus vulgaris]|uniref:Flocculation protein FLO11-like n=1 Tax=Octopus vulgaris TaxID=6645 RepID=A0AA36BVC9_OCTVU|nr:Hypothetical predicted protein [Octopus vulgaris]
MASSCLDRTVSTATENSVGELVDEGAVTVTLKVDYRAEEEFKQDSKCEMQVKNLGKQEPGSDSGRDSVSSSSVLENPTGDSGSAHSDAESASRPSTGASIQESATLLAAPSPTLPLSKRKPPSLSQLVSIDKKTSSPFTSSTLTSRSSPCPSSFSLNSPATPSTTSPPSMPLSMSSSLISPSSHPSLETTGSASSQTMSSCFPAFLPSSDTAVKGEPPEHAPSLGHQPTPPTTSSALPDATHASSIDQRRSFDYQLTHALKVIASDSNTNSTLRSDDGTPIPTDDSPKPQKQQLQQVTSSLRSNTPLVVPVLNSTQQSEKAPSSPKAINQRFRTNNILSRMLLPTFNVSSSGFFSSSASSSPGSPSSISPSSLYPPPSSLASEIPLSPLPTAPPPTPPPPTTPPPPPPTSLLTSPTSTPPSSSPP